MVRPKVTSAVRESFAAPGAKHAHQVLGGIMGLVMGLKKAVNDSLESRATGLMLSQDSIEEMAGV